MTDLRLLAIINSDIKHGGEGIKDVKSSLFETCSSRSITPII